MLIIPAIDLYDGKCVRLYQGKLQEQTVFSEDPLLVARQWAGAGARLLHVVDLNGAFEGVPGNLEVVYEIARTLSIPVQLGGGIRSRELAEEILSGGVERVVLGTSAINNPDFVRCLADDFPGRIVLGIDARNGLVAVKGWTQTTYLRATDLAASFADLPLGGIVFTDIERDGTLDGPNLNSLRKMLKSTCLPLIASGGVGSEGDIRHIAQKFSGQLAGVIVGRALYTGAVDLQEVIERYQNGEAGGEK